MAIVADKTRRALALLVLVAVPHTAHAQSTTAQALFEEGRRAMRDGNLTTGCAKLAESQRLDPAGGTLMNLAACHDKQGKVATAWSEFNDALTQALRDGRTDRVDEAKKQIAQLEPRLARLTLTIDTAHAPKGLAIELDGVALGPASWGTALPLDPGEHRISASAPGYRAWQGQVTMADAGRASIAVPSLEATPQGGETAPAKIDPSSARPEQGDHPTRRHVPAAAWIAGGVGIVGLGVGTAFGISAASKKKDSEPMCTSAGCTPEGASLLRQANGAAWASDVGFGVGIVGLGVATYLFLSAPRESDDAPRAARLTWSIGPHGFAAQGAF